MKKFTSVWMLLILILGSVNSVYGQAPRTLTYQGKISDSGGPINGVHSLTFAVYNAATGGTSLWTETIPGITVTAGNFSVILGKNNPINIQTDKPLWLGVTVDSNSEISPRVELTGSLYSLGIGLPYSATSNLATSLFSVTATANGARAGEFTHSGTNSGQAALFATSTGGNLAFQGMNSGANEGAASLFTTNPANPTATLRVYNSGSGSAVELNNTNTSGTSPVLKISNSGTGNAITANGKIQATQFIGDGSLLTNLPGFSLPYYGTNSGAASFSISNSNNSYGSAAYFTNNNAANNGPVLSVSNGGAGFGVYSTTTNPANSSYAVFGENNGNGVGGGFRVHNASSNSPALQGYTDGVGSALDLQVLNNSSTAPALQITHSGTGNAITANRPIQATKFIGDGSLLTGIPGFSLPFSGSSSNTTTTFSLTNSASSGTLASFNSTDPNNFYSALEVNSAGGPAGSFQISNATNGSNVVSVGQQGIGRGAVIQILNTANASQALYITNNGSGTSIDASTTGTNSVANFAINNASNNSSVINITSAGTGNAIIANRPIQATKFIGDGSLLTNLPSTGGGWGLTGSSGTIDGTNFIGTIDNVPFSIRVNNQKSGKIDPAANNAFYGYTSGRNMTSGILNTAMGGGSLSNNTTGEQNTAVGYNALGSNTTGIQNTAIGSMSLVSSITASGNTALGNQTLVQNTTGDYNTAIGRANMVLNTTGIRNTALGSQALFSNTTGNFNTAIGFNAMYSNTVGSNNTVIGNNADVGSNNLTNATAIGYNAKVASSNSLVLGGTGADAVKVGIGIAAPTEMLEVVGNVKATKFIGDGSLLTGINGLTLPYNSQQSSSAALFTLQNTGTGSVASFKNNSNGNPTLLVESSNGGTGLQLTHTGANGGYSIWASRDIISPRFVGYQTISGSSSGLFQIDNTANPNAALVGNTNGSGPAIWGEQVGNGRGGQFTIVNPSNLQWTVFAETNGLGGAGYFSVTNASSSQAALFAITKGTGSGGVFISNTGKAGDFYNTSNTNPTISVDQSGTGNSLLVKHSGSSGNITVFQNNSSNVARIDKTGKGFFNGGTQTGGADVAEMFDVEGSTNQYEPGDVLVISEKTDRTVEKCSEPNSTKIAGVYATKPGVVLSERDIEEKLDDMVPMGVLGVLPTKVCSENGSIKRGDLLVTSSIAGHAMKAIPVDVNGIKIYPTGAILGKALENFDGERGVVKVLVNVK